jgi:hypothetical protein
MNTTDDLKQIRMETHQLYYNDGIAELAMGLSFAWGGFALLAGNPGLAGLIGLLPIWVRLLKVRVAYPRTGYMKFTGWGEPVGLKALVTFGGAGLLALAVVALSPGKITCALKIDYVLFFLPLLYACMLVATCWLIGWTSGLKRHVIYGMLLTIMLLVGSLEWVSASLLISSLVIALVGGVKMARFIRMNPKRTVTADEPAQ